MRKIVCLVVLVLTMSLMASAVSETVLLSFAGGVSDPSMPMLYVGNGTFVGTTYDGGTNHLGTIFTLANVSGTWTENVVYTAGGGGSACKYPLGSLISDASGNVYGVCYQGGMYDYGLIYQLTPSGGSYTISNLHSFYSCNPNRGVVLSSGVLYGVCGGYQFYSLTHVGSSWQYNVINSANYTWSVVSPLVSDSSGNLFGTTSLGEQPDCIAVAGCGGVFEFVPSTNTITVLHDFVSTDGGFPFGPVIDSSGNLYGSTWFGGTFDLSCYLDTCGTLWRMSLSSGSYTFSSLYSFTGSSGTGGQPTAVTLGAGGIVGGQNLGYSGCGTVWKFASGTFSTLYAFPNLTGSSDGCFPAQPTVVSGNLYVETNTGGSNSDGAIVKIIP